MSAPKMAPLFLCLALGACNNMSHQPKFHPLQETPFFSDGRSSRPPVADTVARGDARLDDLLYTGKVNGKISNALPFPVTAALLERGHERFDIYCSVCHGRLGDGQGMIVKRGFPAPPSYHIDRLRQVPVGYFFDVETNGFGKMYSFSDRIPVGDRWAIAAYIRALQLSQNATLADVPENERAKLEANR